MGKNAFFDAYLYDDADEDSVCDMLEIAILESDPDSKDSDGDTLTDFEEIVYSNTSPINKNTSGLSVTDADDDADGDKLTNREEILANTNPQLDDSDLDGINDYDELKKYKIDPNNEDSDNDGIIDGDEIKLGLKPDSDKSDGQTPDNQRTFENKISASNDLLSHINTEDTPYEVSIDIKSAGNIEKTLTIHTGAFSNTSEDDRFIGKSIMFSYDEKLTVDTAKIYFKPKSIDGSIENYMIFEFFPETNYLLPVETKYTSDSAYVETNELGTFTLVKIKDSSRSSTSVKMAPYNVLADEKSEISVGKNDVVYDYELGALEVAFFVDISGSLTDNLEETKKSIHDCSQAIFEHSNNAYVEIIGYYTAPNLSANKLIVYNDSANDTLFNSIDSVDEALEELSPSITDTKNTLNSAIFTLDGQKDNLFSNDNSQKYAFIMSNSDYSFTNGNEYKLTIPIAVRDSFEEIYDSTIHLNFLLSKGIFANTTAVNNLKAACKPYNFGVYSNSETGYFGNTGFARIYSDAITDIFKESICYITALTPQKVPTEVNRNAFLNSLPSSYDKSKVPAADANGNINFKDAAVKIGAADYDENGNLVFPSMLDVCSYNELTRIGYEQYMKNRSTSERLIAGSIQITPFSDKILYEDTDGDGIINKFDLSPEVPIDSSFKLINSIDSVTIDDVISASYKEIIETSKNNHGSIESDWNDGLKDKVINKIMVLGGYTNFSRTALYLDEGMFRFGSTPNGSRALNHYLANNGKDLYIDLYIPLGAVAVQRNKYYNQMNSFFDMVEQTIKPGKKYCFSTTAYPNKDIWQVDYKDRSLDFNTYGQIEDDCFLAIGGANNALVSEVTIDESTNDIKQYNAKIIYYLYDFYDWDGTEEKDLDNLNKYGKAKGFRTIGTYTFDISWVHGARYPNSVNQSELSTTSFEGINDYDKLKNSYHNALNWYNVKNIL
ncbi:hypothetical protein [Ruminococcus flavefaciens]|uniref:hypothetical protein n=1 Tax=Ruminococcus flavefaciens TaxID=1265 RepID=UPI0026EF1040|nr:hypothetical protein [Ruminococcus flavefaciens]